MARGCYNENFNAPPYFWPRTESRWDIEQKKLSSLGQGKKIIPLQKKESIRINRLQVIQKGEYWLLKSVSGLGPGLIQDKFLQLRSSLQYSLPPTIGITSFAEVSKPICLYDHSAMKEITTTNYYNYPKKIVMLLYIHAMSHVLKECNGKCLNTGLFQQIRCSFMNLEIWGIKCSSISEYFSKVF